jgi:hypothetical protein
MALQDGKECHWMFLVGQTDGVHAVGVFSVVVFIITKHDSVFKVDPYLFGPMMVIELSQWL